MTDFPGIGHVALTVTDLSVSFRTGLDHLAFGCADRDSLAQWQRRLDELEIAHGGTVDTPYGSGLSFRDADGIALEFFAPPG